MTAYLDINVWVDIGCGNYYIDTFRKVDVEFFFSDNLIEELFKAEGNPKVSVQMRLEMIDRLCGKNFILADFIDNKPDVTVRKSAFDRYNELKKPSYRVLRNRIHKGQIDADKLCPLPC